jgi:putative hydrolase of the HAD superfamily
MPKAEVPSCYTPSEMACAIDTLIFDLDDTLIVEEASAEAAFLETGELVRTRHGLDPGELHRTVRKTCRDLWYAFPSHPYCKRVGISSWEGMWAEFAGEDPELKPLREWAATYRFESWRDALRSHGIDDPELAAELADRFPRVRRRKHFVYPDAVRTLKKLAGTYSLGLLSNGAPDLQRTKLEGSGLSCYFDQVLIAGEVGFGKPDPRVFTMLLNRLGSTAEKTLMIGDRLETDVQGAHNAGMRAVWMNRSGESNDGSIAPEWEISGLTQLVPILEQLQSADVLR